MSKKLIQELTTNDTADTDSQLKLVYNNKLKQNDRKII